MIIINNIIIIIILLRLLPAPIWLWGRCGRHNSPPASSVINFIFCCPDSSHVSVDTVHPSLLRSSSLSSSGWYHLQSLYFDVVLVSPLYVAKQPQSRFPAPLCDTLYLQSILDVFVSYMIFSVWPHAHLQIFISVTSSFFTWDLVTGTVSIPYSISWLNDHLVDLSFNMCGTLLSHRTSDTFLSCSIHTVSSCLLLYSCHRRSAGCFPGIWIIIIIVTLLVVVVVSMIIDTGISIYTNLLTEITVFSSRVWSGNWHIADVIRQISYSMWITVGVATMFEPPVMWQQWRQNTCAPIAI